MVFLMTWEDCDFHRIWDVISYGLDACSAKAFSLVKVYKDNIKSDPGAHDVIWMTFSMVWMLALPQYPQHSKKYK